MEWSVWLSREPAQVPSLLATLFAFVLALLTLGSLGIRLWSDRKKEQLSKEYRRFWRHVAAKGLMFAVSGATLLLISYQQVWFLGARGWYLLWLVLFGVFAYRAQKAFRSTLPRLVAERAAVQRWRSYLPPTN